MIVSGRFHTIPCSDLLASDVLYIMHLNMNINDKVKRHVYRSEIKVLLQTVQGLHGMCIWEWKDGQLSWKEASLDAVTQQNVQCNWYEMWKRKILFGEDSLQVQFVGHEKCCFLVNIIIGFKSEGHFILSGVSCEYFW